MPSPYDANLVADYLLCFCRKHGDLLTNLKLQKLLYYVQAWHLAIRDEPLIRGHFQAWVHGPVHPEVYHRFKSLGGSPIDASGIEAPELGISERKLIVDVMGVYGGMSGFELERYTHQEEPWLTARGSLSPDQSSTVAISESLMKQYYRKRLMT